MIPCKELKCLKYPVCMSEQVILCDLLLEYHEEYYKNLYNPNTFTNTDRFWKNLKRYMPKVTAIMGE